MSDPTITNNDLGSVIYKNAEHEDALLTFAGAGTVLEGTLLARKDVDDAVVAAADAGNTGDGTVTSAAVLGGADIPAAGAWNLECTVAKAVAGTPVADGGNTGDGTVTGFATSATGAPAAVGTYTLECTDATTNDTRVMGSVTADVGNTGDGTVTEEAISATGAPAKIGTYTVECVEAILNSGRFKLVDPDGVEIVSNILIPAGAGNNVVYTGAGLTFKVTDGATDFAVGDKFTFPITGVHGGIFKLTGPGDELIANDITLPGTASGSIAYTGAGITFTVNDGATDFAVGDKFTLPLTGGEFDVFKLEDPNGAVVANDLQLTPGDGAATTFVLAGLTFIVTDGATDFVVGDKFSLTVAANGKMVPFAVDGKGGAQVPKAVATYAITATGAGDVASRVMVSGDVRKERLIIDADGDGSNITASMLDQLRAARILAISVTELNDLDNQ